MGNRLTTERISIRDMSTHARAHTHTHTHREREREREREILKEKRINNFPQSDAVFFPL